MTDSFSDMTKALLAGYQSLATRVIVVEEACGVQAEASRKRRHDDHDPSDQHEGEKRSAGVGESSGTATGNVEGSDQQAGEQGTGTGGTDTVMEDVEEIQVLADVLTGVEKPAVVDNRTEEERMADDFLNDFIYIDSDEDPEKNLVQIKGELQDVFDVTGVIMAAQDSDNEAPNSKPIVTTDQSVGTSDQAPQALQAPPAPQALIAPIAHVIAPIVRIQAEGRIRDRVLDAELDFFQRILDAEPGYVATGLRVRILSPY